MFQNNPALRKKFLRVSTVSGLMGIPLAFILQGTFLTKYILIAITCIGMFVLLHWVLNILDENNHELPSKKTKIMIAISTVTLFLLIQYFLVGVIGNLIFRYHEQRAMQYCETVGRAAEEYKALNGEYPNQNVLRAAIEVPRPRLVIHSNDYVYDSSFSEGEGPYCLFPYLKENPFESKVFSIPDEKWFVHVHR